MQVVGDEEATAAKHLHIAIHLTCAGAQSRKAQRGQGQAGAGGQWEADRRGLRARRLEGQAGWSMYVGSMGRRVGEQGAGSREKTGQPASQPVIQPASHPAGQPIQPIQPMHTQPFATLTRELSAPEDSAAGRRRAARSGAATSRPSSAAGQRSAQSTSAASWAEAAAAQAVSWATTWLARDGVRRSSGACYAMLVCFCTRCQKASRGEARGESSGGVVVAVVRQREDRR